MKFFFGNHVIYRWNDDCWVMCVLLPSLKFLFDNVTRRQDDKTPAKWNTKSVKTDKFRTLARKAKWTVLQFKHKSG